MARIAFHLPAPIETLRDSGDSLVDSMTRPLSDNDYWQASHQAKDGKQAYNEVTMGAAYFLRHSRRSMQSGDRKGAAKNAALAVACTPLMVLNVMSACFPAYCVVAVRMCLPTKRRSELATRENCMAVAIYEYALVVGSLGDLRQYHQPGRQKPLTVKDLAAVYDQSEATIKRVTEYIATSPSRIRESSLLSRNMRYLKKRQKPLRDRIRRELSNS